MRGLVAVAALSLVSACHSIAGTLDYADVPWFRGRGPEDAASSCSDLASQWRDLATQSEAKTPPRAGSSASSEPPSAYYVSPSGDDSASGATPEQAWRSLERVNQQTLQPGERVLFAGGASFAGTLRLQSEDSGTLEAPVTIGSFGPGRAQIEAGAETAIEITSASALIVRDLILHGDWNGQSQSGNAGFGIHAQNTLGGGKRLPLLRFVELEISGFREAGIAIEANPPDQSKDNGYEGVEIAQSEVHDNGDCGIVTGGPFAQSGSGYSHRAVLVHHVRAYRNRGIAHKGEHTGSGIVLADVDGAAIERCVAHDNGEFNDNPGGGGFGIWAWDANAVVIQHNESYANKSQTADGGGFDLDGGITHSWLQYNYSHDNHGAGLAAFQFTYARPHGANVVRYNISQDDGAGLLLWDENGDLEGLAIHNNVAYEANAALATYSPLKSVRLLHNIFYATGSTLLDVADGAGLTFQGNDYFSAEAAFHIAWNSAGAAAQYASFDDFRAGTKQEQRKGVATGLEADPRLLGAGSGGNIDDAELLDTLEAYKLADDSPLIDRGLDLRAYDLEPGCQDFFGNPIPQGNALDIGADERR